MSKEQRGVEQLVSSSLKYRKRVWSLSVPPRVNHFLWKHCKGDLAIGTAASKRLKGVERGCVRYGVRVETDCHLLLDCPYAKMA